MGVGGWLLVCEGAFRCLSVPTGDWDCLLASEGAYWFLRVPTGA